MGRKPLATCEEEGCPFGRKVSVSEKTAVAESPPGIELKGATLPNLLRAKNRGERCPNFYELHIGGMLPKFMQVHIGGALPKILACYNWVCAPGLS